LVGPFLYLLMRAGRAMYPLRGE